jgi:hypothetical protein
LVFRSRDAPHFIPSHVCGDVFVECRELAIAPVFVKDVEPQRVTLDDEVVESGHRVRVVTGAAHHTAKLVADFLDDEELLRRSDTKSQPHPITSFSVNLDFHGPG